MHPNVPLISLRPNKNKLTLIGNLEGSQPIVVSNDGKSSALRMFVWAFGWYEFKLTNGPSRVAVVQVTESKLLDALDAILESDEVPEVYNFKSSAAITTPEPRRRTIPSARSQARTRQPAPRANS